MPSLKVHIVDPISCSDRKRRKEEVQKWADCLENPIQSFKLKDTGEINCTVFSKPHEEFFKGAANTLPSSSSNHGLGSNRPKARKLGTRAISSGSDDDSTINLRGDIYCNLVWKIVDLMMNNIDTESGYIFYLKELCRLEYETNTDSSDALENFNIVGLEPLSH